MYNKPSSMCIISLCSNLEKTLETTKGEAAGCTPPIKEGVAPMNSFIGEDTPPPPPPDDVLVLLSFLARLVDVVFFSTGGLDLGKVLDLGLDPSWSKIGNPNSSKMAGPPIDLELVKHKR